MIVSAFFLQNCATSKDIELKKDKISNLRRIGIISVYTAHGESPSLIGLAIGSSQIEEWQRRLRAASPSQQIMDEFMSKLKRLINADLVIISENEMAVASVKETKKIGAVVYDHYALEKLDFASLREKFWVESLITITTSDYSISGS